MGGSAPNGVDTLAEGNVEKSDEVLAAVGSESSVKLFD